MGRLHRNFGVHAIIHGLVSMRNVPNAIGRLVKEHSILLIRHVIQAIICVGVHSIIQGLVSTVGGWIRNVTSAAGRLVEEHSIMLMRGVCRSLKDVGRLRLARFVDPP